MGKTAYSGPVYGAKSLIWTAGPAAAASTNADTNASFAQPGYSRITVPAGQDWYVTDAYLVCSTCSSVASAAQWKLKVEGGTTSVFRPSNQSATNAATILTIASGGSSNVEKWAAAGISAGEYEGTYCPTGSTVRWCSSYADAPTSPQMNVYGYIRFLNSSGRAE